VQNYIIFPIQKILSIIHYYLSFSPSINVHHSFLSLGRSSESILQGSTFKIPSWERESNDQSPSLLKRRGTKQARKGSQLGGQWNVPMLGG
jgi:hypothetical protein